MHETQEKKWIISGLILAGFVLSAVAVFTEVPAGGADNYAHFNIARWAFRYPHLFLDHWGKPIFTILTAPFAQTGFIGVRIFNTATGLLTAWYTYKILNLFQLKHAWFSVVVVIFTPIYFVLISSGMTEILFGFFLVFSIFLFFKEKYFASALFVSILFLVRTEGVIFLPLFFIALLFKKKYKTLPLLLSGFLVFSLIGWIYYYNDFWWLITKRPYITGNATVYGSGYWDHYFIEMPDYFGYIIGFLLFAGTVVLLLTWVKEKFDFRKNTFFLILLVLGSFWGYFFAHVFLWWQTENSAGLVRVMAGVSPLIAIPGVFALNTNRISDRFKEPVNWILRVVSVILIVNASLFYSHVVKSDLSAEVLKRTSNWLKDSGSLNYKLVMHNPYFAFSTELDAWNDQKVQYGFKIIARPELGLPDSTLFIWDAHFSANEGKMPLEVIMNNPNFELIKYFYPEYPFKVMGNNDYKLFVFRKITNAGKNNLKILEQLKEDEFKSKTYYNEKYDFEKPFTDETLELRRIKREDDSLNYCYSLKDAEFSHSFQIEKKQIEEDENNKFRLTAEFNLQEQILPNKFFMVFSVEKSDSSIFYAASDIKEQISEDNVWNKTEFIFKLPRKLESGTIIKSYIWNIDKKDILMDNFKLELFKEKQNNERNKGKFKIWNRYAGSNFGSR